MLTRARSARRALVAAPIVVSLVLSAGVAEATPDLVPLLEAARIVQRAAVEDPGTLPPGLTEQVSPKAAKAAAPKKKKARPRRRLTSKQRLGFQWPAKGWITSGFGWRHGSFHHGTDIACRKMSRIHPAKAGKVIFRKHIPIYGKTIVIQHSKGYSTLYAHLAVTQVRVGKRVTPKTTIGKCGSTGNSTGPHLHFELRRNGVHLKPRPFLP